jgi:hypothetical protein
MGAPRESIANEIDKIEQAMPGLPKSVVGMMVDTPAGTCGRCVSYQRNADGSIPAQGMCEYRGLTVTARDPECPLYDPVPR